jgi:hypothetical protein
LENLNYKPQLLCLYGNKIAHVVAMAQENGTYFALEHGRLLTSSKNIPDLVNKLNSFIFPEKSNAFVLYKVLPISGKSDWKITEENLCPYLNKEDYYFRVKEFLQGTKIYLHEKAVLSKSSEEFQDWEEKLNAVDEQIQELTKEIKFYSKKYPTYIILPRKH